MRKRALLAVAGLGLGVVLVLSGCSMFGGGKGSTSSGQADLKKYPTVVGDPAAAEYAGAANLAKYEALAKANPKKVSDQVNAGKSAFVNGKYDLALSYYRKALDIDPKEYMANDAIGNIYFYNLKEPKTALPYYDKVIAEKPDYGYGWFSKAMCQKSLGDTAGAKATLTKSLTVVPKTDSLYKVLSRSLTQLK